MTLIELRLYRRRATLPDLIAGAQYSREQTGAVSSSTGEPYWELYLAPVLQYRHMVKGGSMTEWVDVKQVREGDEEQPVALRIEQAAE